MSEPSDVSVVTRHVKVVGLGPLVPPKATQKLVEDVILEKTVVLQKAFQYFHVHLEECTGPSLNFKTT